MKCFEIINDYPRFWNRETYPIVAHVSIEAKHFDQFERLAADQTQVRVLGHDLADHDQIIVHVACISADVRRRLEIRWA